MRLFVFNKFLLSELFLTLSSRYLTALDFAKPIVNTSFFDAYINASMQEFADFVGGTFSLPQECVNVSHQFVEPFIYLLAISLGVQNDNSTSYPFQPHEIV